MACVSARVSSSLEPPPQARHHQRGGIRRIVDLLRHVAAHDLESTSPPSAPRRRACAVRSRAEIQPHPLRRSVRTPDLEARRGDHHAGPGSARRRRLPGFRRGRPGSCDTPARRRRRHPDRYRALRPLSLRRPYDGDVRQDRSLGFSRWGSVCGGWPAGWARWGTSLAGAATKFASCDFCCSRRSSLPPVGLIAHPARTDRLPSWSLSRLRSSSERPCKPIPQPAQPARYSGVSGYCDCRCCGACGNCAFDCCGARSRCGCA